MQRWLEACEVDYLLVGTKVDKLPQSEIKKQKDKLNATYFDSGEGELFVYSSKSGRGRKELWREIITRIEVSKKKDIL